jgi:predicted amidohydrolase
VDSAVTQWSDVNVVLFPECFLYNGSNAETIEHGAIVTAMQKKAAQHKIYLIVPIYELLQQGQSQDGPTFNTAVLLGRNGSVVGKYHKHFPTTYEMDANVIPGSGSVVPVFDLDFGRTAILISPESGTQHDISTESFLTCYFSARSPERHPLGCM